MDILQARGRRVRGRSRRSARRRGPGDSRSESSAGKLQRASMLGCALGVKQINLEGSRQSNDCSVLVSWSLLWTDTKSPNYLCDSWVKSETKRNQNSYRNNRNTNQTKQQTRREPFSVAGFHFGKRAPCATRGRPAGGALELRGLARAGSRTLLPASPGRAHSEGDWLWLCSLTGST